MTTLALFGAGRIGAMHAQILDSLPDVNLKYLSDPVAAAAGEVAGKVGAEVVEIDQALGDSEVDAVLIASSTDSHADLIERSARAGKAIFCEKPIHLDSDRVRKCLEVVKETGALLAIGFNRRFDSHFAAFKVQLEAGAVGELELLSITSRDPAPPPISYIEVSGGIFRDMTIHDFDLARWLLAEEPIEVTARGSCLVEPAIGEAGDYDTALVIMRTASGRLCQINNSRRAVYGYDQRLEAHGSKGMLEAGNPADTTLAWTDEKRHGAQTRLDISSSNATPALTVLNSTPLSTVSGAARWTNLPPGTTAFAPCCWPTRPPNPPRPALASPFNREPCSRTPIPPPGTPTRPTDPVTTSARSAAAYFFLRSSGRPVRSFSIFS